MVPAKSAPRACSRSAFLRPGSNRRCSKRLTTTRGCGPSPSRSRIAATSALAWRMLGTVISLTMKGRFEIEIVGAGAVLEIEIDQADGGADALAAVEQQQRGLDRQGSDAGTANRGNEGVDLRFFGLGDGRARDSRAGADKLDRLHRLD